MKETRKAVGSVLLQRELSPDPTVLCDSPAVNARQAASLARLETIPGVKILQSTIVLVFSPGKSTDYAVGPNISNINTETLSLGPTGKARHEV